MFHNLSPRDLPLKGLSGMSSSVLFLADFTNESRLFGIRVRGEIFGKSPLLEEDFNENTKSAKNLCDLCDLGGPKIRVNPRKSVSNFLPTGMAYAIRALACRVEWRKPSLSGEN